MAIKKEREVLNATNYEANIYLLKMTFKDTTVFVQTTSGKQKHVIP